MEIIFNGQKKNVPAYYANLLIAAGKAMLVTPTKEEKPKKQNKPKQ